ncbi:MAG: peptidylprolyl isomerase, partial [Gammaproteobacteria bacterium]
LNKTIGNIAAQNKLTLSQFRDVLEKDGFSFTRFREEMRQEIIIRRLLQRQVESRISVTEQEVDNFLVNQKTQGKAHDEYHLGHILIALPEAASPAEIRQARERAQKILEELRRGRDFSETAIAVSDGQQALKGGDLSWRQAGELPTLFVDVVRDMKVGDVSDLIRSPSGFHIIKLLEHRSGQRHLVTQSHARHILIRPDGLTSEEQALETAHELRRRILAGEDFAQLAREYSDDKASAVDGGDLGWVSPGQMVSEFEQALAKLEPGLISEPVKSGFGWHLIQVLERRQHDDTDEFTRNQARKQIFQRKAEEAQSNWLRRLRDEAYVEYRL